MIGQMAIAISFPGFSDLGRTVTPAFLLVDHFLYQFSALSKTHDRVPFLLALRSSVRRFQMPFERLSFVQTLVKFDITDLRNKPTSTK